MDKFLSGLKLQLKIFKNCCIAVKGLNLSLSANSMVNILNFFYLFFLNFFHKLLVF